MRRIVPNVVHTAWLPPLVVIYNPVVEARSTFFLYSPLVDDVLAAAKTVRALRLERRWSAAEAARRITDIAAALERPIELSQQAVSKFETGKGKSIPGWTRLLEMAVEFDRLGSEERIAYLNVRRNSLKPKPPMQDRIQLVASFVAMPGPELLSEMFEMMLRSMPSVPREALPRELAKLLPTALEQMRYSMFEMTAPPAGSLEEPSEDRDAENRGTRQAART